MHEDFISIAELQQLLEDSQGVDLGRVAIRYLPLVDRRTDVLKLDIDPDILGQFGKIGALVAISFEYNE